MEGGPYVHAVSARGRALSEVLPGFQHIPFSLRGLEPASWAQSSSHDVAFDLDSHAGTSRMRDNRLVPELTRRLSVGQEPANKFFGGWSMVPTNVLHCLS